MKNQPAHSKTTILTSQLTLRRAVKAMNDAILLITGSTDAEVEARHDLSVAVQNITHDVLGVSGTITPEIAEWFSRQHPAPEPGDDKGQPESDGEGLTE